MPFAFDEFVFDETRRELRESGVLLKVDGQVLALLEHLLRNPERLVTKEELIDTVWAGRSLGDNVISVCVAKLRKVIDARGPRCIGNVYGRGYRFLRPVQEIAAPAPRPSQPPLPPLAAASASVSPLVGRGAELRRLTLALSAALAGHGRACALLGEAGIGKTRLAEVLEERALAAGFAVAWGRCHAFGDVPPLWPWREITRAYQSVTELGAPPFDDLAHAELREPVASQDWQAQAAHTWHRTLSFMTRALSQLSAAQPCLIVLEDLQWADAASLELLAQLLVQSADQRVLFVLTVRNTEAPRDERGKRALDYVLGHRACERIELSRLVTSEVTTYVHELFGASESGLCDAVFQKCEGNPFFMVELLRPWLIGPAPQSNQLALSGASLDIVRQALRRLDADALPLMRAAAVIGRSFDLGLLAAVTGREAEAVLETLEGSIAEHLVVAARESRTSFAFGHDLIRSVLYDELSSSARARLHAEVARALAQRHAGDDPASTASSNTELAHHLLSALPSGDVLRAVSCGQGAARAAMRVGAYADACSFFQRVLDALHLHPAPDPKLRCDLLLELARCERATGGHAYEQHFQEAVALARQHAYGSVLAAVGQEMSNGPGTLAMNGATEVLQAALDALPETDRATRAVVLSHLSWTMPQCRDPSAVSALLARATVLAEGSATATFNVLRARLYYAGGPEDHERALGFAQQLEQVTANGTPIERAYGASVAQVARVLGLLQRGELARAQDAMDAFGHAAAAVQHAELLWHHDRMRLVLRMNAGDFEYARAALTELYERAERLQLYARKTVAAIDWGVLLRHTTDTKPFAAQFAHVLRHEPADHPSIQAQKLHVLAQLGLVDEARAQLQSLTTAQLRALPPSRDYLATLAHLAGASATSGSSLHDATLYELLAPHAQRCVVAISFHCYGVVAYFLGLLARAQGQRARALAHFEDALQGNERLGFTPQVARTRYELARSLLEGGQAPEKERARVLLEQVRASASALGMQPLRTQAESLL